MSGSPTTKANAEAAAPRFDRKFIEDNELLERYLRNQLPFKGARDLERWCLEHPEFLDEMGLADRAQASLKLLEASGNPQDLSEPGTPWWRKPHFLVGLGAVTLFSLLGFWVMFGKNVLLRGQLAAAQAQVRNGTMTAPSSEFEQRVAPDRAPGVDQARVAVNHKTAQLVDLRIDMSYAHQDRFRMTVDKRDQGRALVINDIARDSNGELRVSFNSSALAGGEYDVRIEGLPFRGAPIAAGWLKLIVS